MNTSDVIIHSTGNFKSMGALDGVVLLGEEGGGGRGERGEGRGERGEGRGERGEGRGERGEGRGERGEGRGRGGGREVRKMKK